MYFYCVCSRGLVLHFKGTWQVLKTQVLKYSYSCSIPINLQLSSHSDSTPSLRCSSGEEWECPTCQKSRYQKRPRSHQRSRWWRRWHVSQLPPHHPASCTFSWVTSSLMRGLKKRSWGFLPKDVQEINNNSPKKVCTILKYYFNFVHWRSLLDGKAVGVELRTWY